MNDKPGKVVSEAKAVTPFDVLPLVGSSEALRKVVQRVNKKINPLSQDKSPDAAVPEDLKLTLSGQLFLQIDKFLRMYP